MPSRYCNPASILPFAGFRFDSESAFSGRVTDGRTSITSANASSGPQATVLADALILVLPLANRLHQEESHDRLSNCRKGATGGQSLSLRLSAGFSSIISIPHRSPNELAKTNQMMASSRPSSISIDTPCSRKRTDSNNRVLPSRRITNPSYPAKGPVRTRT